ncbi:MAG: esterase-like activity of phytase family protein [Paracoccaceae bacterium]
MRRRSALALIAGLVFGGLTLSGQARQGDGLTYLGAYSWHVEDANFGGLSGLEFSADGSGFTAISDHGFVLSGRVRRADGVVSDVSAGPILPLLDRKGRPLAGPRRDPEGLAIAPTAAPSSRSRATIASGPIPRLTASGAAAAQSPRFRPYAKYSLEALAVTRGWLYTLPGRVRKLTRPFPLYRFRGGKWDRSL